MSVLQNSYTTAYYASWTPDELVIWRFVRDQGGYWTAAELQSAMKRPGAAYRIGSLLQRMCAEDYLVRKMRGEVWAYGFTARCYAPEGESLTPATVPTPALFAVSAGGAA